MDVDLFNIKKNMSLIINMKRKKAMIGNPPRKGAEKVRFWKWNQHEKWWPKSRCILIMVYNDYDAWKTWKGAI